MSFETQVAEAAGRGAEGVCDLVALVVAEGARRGASDIHIEPEPERLLLRFRLDGVLYPALAIPTSFGTNVVARVKVLADLLTYQTDVPQEGRINKSKVGAASDLRVSTFPTVHGEKIVIRLFDTSTQSVKLEQLGYPDSARKELERQLRMPKGVILLTGPAGSGKTTTMYAAARFILDETRGARNIVTVEDPVERLIPGVTQTQVHPASGLTYARCLRSLMRQDPEVIVIGEIRDRETAEIAVEAGLTGHLVISAIHSGTAVGVFTRLLDMKIEPYLITSSVAYVAAQRLIRKLCPKCRATITEPAALLGMPGNLLGHACAPAGCDACFQTGYLGRTVLVESLVMSEPLHKHILSRTTTEALEAAALAEGMAPLRVRAEESVRYGITSPAEIRRILGPE